MGAVRTTFGVNVVPNAVLPVPLTWKAAVRTFFGVKGSAAASAPVPDTWNAEVRRLTGPVLGVSEEGGGGGAPDAGGGAAPDDPGGGGVTGFAVPSFWAVIGVVTAMFAPVADPPWLHV